MSTRPADGSQSASSAVAGQSSSAGQEPLREQSIGELLKQLSAETSTLVKQELALAKAELSQQGKRAGAGAGMLGAAGVTGLLALGALTAFLILLLDKVMDASLAALIVTLLWAAVAGALALTGKKKIQEATPPAPQTVETVKEDVEWAKTQKPSGAR